jgi:hypothetical protein
MGRVIFMCGPAGSGKSTVARQLEQRGMTRLCFGQEARSRGITAMPLPEDVHRDIEHLLRTAGGSRPRRVRRGPRLLVLVPSHAGRIPAVPEAIWRRSGNGVPGDRPGHGAPAHRCPGGGGRRRLHDQHRARGLLLRSFRSPLSGGGTLDCHPVTGASAITVTRCDRPGRPGHAGTACSARSDA